MAAARLRAGAAVVAGTNAGGHQAVPLPRPATAGVRLDLDVRRPPVRRLGAAPDDRLRLAERARGTSSPRRSALPDWVAHRLWIGTIMFAAGTGRRLGRRAGSGSRPRRRSPPACVYQLSPYLVPYISRTSSMLLPWAGLGWIVGLTIGAATRTRWRDAALCALVDRHRRSGQRDGPGDDRPGSGAVACSSPSPSAR